MRTLRGRLLISTALGTGLVLSAAALALYLVVSAAVWAEFDEALASKARSLATLVEQDGAEIELEIDEKSLPEYGTSQRAEYFQFWKPGGEVLARSASLGGVDLSQTDENPDGPAYAHTALPDGRSGRIVQITFNPRQEEDNLLAEADAAPIELLLVIARDTMDIERTLGRLRALLISGCAAAILVSVLVLSWSVRRGLKPLDHIAAEIAAIGEADLSTRLHPGASPGELVPVVTRLNDLLTRLEKAFTREKAFTSDVAHELRTPLASLRTTLEVSLLKERTAGAYQEAITQSVAICEQMQRMVDNLLELARADAGQLDVANESADLATLARDSWMQFAERAAGRQLEVSWQMPEACPVTTDPTKVRLVLNNILDNAVTYADPGGQVTIALHSANDSVNLSVANTGSGVAQDDAERVFDRFWRGDTARTSDPNDRRYGLGLPLCRKLIHLLGGSISVSTTSGGAFTISLTLPR